MGNQDALAELLTMEQGKSLTEAKKGEVGSSAAYMCCGSPERGSASIWRCGAFSVGGSPRAVVTKKGPSASSRYHADGTSVLRIRASWVPRLPLATDTVVKPASPNRIRVLRGGALCEAGNSQRH